jgi:hypothetical protein
MDLSLSMSNMSRRQDITISQSGTDAQVLGLGFNDDILADIETGRDMFYPGAGSDLQLADLGLDDMNEIEMAREAGIDRSLTMDDIGAPLERMNIKDANEDNAFDFDLGSEPDILPTDEAQLDRPIDDNSSFDLPDMSMMTENNSGTYSIFRLSMAYACTDTLSTALVLDTQAIGDDLLFDVETPAAQANTPQVHRRRLIIDKVTELPHDKIRDQINDTSDIVSDATFLPTTVEMLQVRNIEKQGVRLFFNLDAPSFLAPELQSLFTRSRKRSPSVISVAEEDEDHHRKQQRIEPATTAQAATARRAEEEEDEFELSVLSEEVDD